MPLKGPQRWTDEQLARIVHLREVTKMSFAEIGEVYSIGIEWAKRLYSKARWKLDDPNYHTRQTCGSCRHLNRENNKCPVHHNHRCRKTDNACSKWIPVYARRVRKRA